MKKKKPIIITTAVIILCIITLILGIKVVQKKKEVQTKQELIQSQQELINYIKNDGMNVENKDIYTARIEKTTTKEELDPIRQEYEKEAEVLREAIEADKAELIEQIGERGYIGEEEVSKYTTELKEIRTNEEYEKKKVEIEEAERQKEVEVKEEVKEEIGQLEYISTEEYIEQIEEAESKGEIESIKKEAQEADEAEGILSSVVQENLTGVRVVRAFGRESFERKRFDEKNERFAGLWIYLGKFLSLYWSIGDLITGIQILTVICMGVLFTVDGNLTVGEFIAFVSYNSSMAWPVRSLGRIISEMSKAGVSIDRIAYILDEKEEDDRPGVTKPAINKDIVFDKVNFKYEEGAAVLKDVSFTVPAGKTFAILGNTGSGKSTLVHLLNRLYDLPDGCGKITIGGVDIRDIDRQYLRSQIGMVLQEPFLYSGSIKENVGITKESSAFDDIREACEIACVDSAIDSFTDGYETIVGERGVTLSGGQKQRVAIARMLVEHTPVMIFDDSLSAVDAQTDAMIREALKKRMAGTTVILIAHRITTLMQADCIMVLEDGAVAEMGSHEQLMEHHGIYRRIYDIQMNTQLDADSV